MCFSLSLALIIVILSWVVSSLFGWIWGGEENGNAALVRSEFSLRRVAATSGDSSLVREFDDESSRGNRNLARWLSEVADVSGGVYPTRLALVAHRVMVAAGVGPGEWV